MTEFEKGYKKCIEDLKSKGIDVSKILNENVENPIIRYTRLNKKGELEFDKERTFGNTPGLELIDKKDPRYKKVVSKVVGKKTKEMCEAENTFLWGGFKIPSGHSPEYLNTLGNQLSFLAQDPTGFIAMCNATGVDFKSENALDEIIEKVVGNEYLFVGN